MNFIRRCGHCQCRNKKACLRPMPEGEQEVGSEAGEEPMEFDDAEAHEHEGE